MQFPTRSPAVRSFARCMIVAFAIILLLCGFANAQTTAFIVSPASLNFSVAGGATGAIPQQLDVNSSGAPITFLVTASSTGNWLSVIGSTPVGFSGSDGIWQATTPFSVSVFVDPSNLTAGDYTGTITISSSGATNSSQAVTVSLSVGSPPSITANPSSLTFTANTGDTSPITKNIAFSITPSSSVLNFTAVASGGSWLSISYGGNSLPGNINAVINPLGLAAGNYSGSVILSVVGARNSPLTVPVTLTVTKASLPIVTINQGGIVPIFSTATTIQPGSWISIYGSNLVSSLDVWNGLPPTPKSLGGASVKINGKDAFLWVAIPKEFGNTDQINLQAPDDTATGTVTVAVTNASNGTATSTVTLGIVGPSFNVLGDGVHAAALIPTPNGDGAEYGGAYDIDGPTGTSLGFATRPVKAGEFLILYGTGFGPTNPPVPSGAPYSGPPGGAPMTDSFTLSIGGVPVPAGNITYAAEIGQGLYQINVKVPSGLGTGDKKLSATIAGVTTPSTVAIAVQ